MSEQTQGIVSAAPTTQRHEPLDGMRQVVYAWVDLWGVAAEDFGKFYQRCVARGEQLLNAQPRAARPVVEPAAAEAGVNRSKSAAPRRIRPTTIMNAFGAVESYHIDLNAEGILPTKQEIDALSERVEALSREVDELVKQREHG